MNLFVNVIVFHRLWIVMVTRLSFGTLFVVICLVGRFSYKKMIHLLILVHKKTPFIIVEFIQSVRRIHISPVIEFW